MEVREQYYIQHSNRFAILENSNDSEDINRVLEDIEENMKVSAKEGLGQYEREKHKPRFDEERSEILDQRKGSKMQGYRIQTQEM
jgi:hypothetical protein